MNKVITAYDFLQCVWGKGVNTRKVCDDDLFTALGRF